MPYLKEIKQIEKNKNSPIMQKLILPMLALAISIVSHAQQKNVLKISEDTIKIGSIVIINKETSENNKDWKTSIKIADSNSLGLVGDFKKTSIKINTEKKPLKNVSTSFFNFDFGFANYIDRTEPLYYVVMPQQGSIMPAPLTSNSLKLNNIKSSNVNVWIVQQKVNLSKNKLNLKYGIGFEMFNFRFENPISFRNEAPIISIDNIAFSKDKLFVKYLTVPFQLNFSSNPGSKKGFYASIGMSAGYLIKARNKQISSERGKQKINGNFNLNDWRVATIGELGIGSVRLYSSFGLTNLFDKNQTSFDMAPFALGIRFY